MVKDSSPPSHTTMDWIVTLPTHTLNSYVEALAFNVMVFGSGVFCEIIKFR